MGTVLLLTIVGQLLVWDVLLKVLSAFARPAARRRLERRLPGMARRLLVLAQCYGPVRLDLDRALTTLASPVVVCSNHQSVIDIAVILAAMPHHRIRFVAKQELARGFPAVSEVLRIQRHALINRRGDYRETSARLRRLGRSIRDGVSPVVFPEGTRSRTGEVQQFFPAGVRMILSTGNAPIAAVAVDGGYRLASLGDVLRPLGRVDYRARLVGLFEHAGDKRSVLRALEDAHAAVVRQVETWRAEDR